MMRLIQSDGNCARIYGCFQEREKKPLTGTQALGALTNELPQIRWALLKHPTFYGPVYEISA